MGILLLLLYTVYQALESDKGVIYWAYKTAGPSTLTPDVYNKHQIIFILLFSRVGGRDLGGVRKAGKVRTPPPWAPPPTPTTQWTLALRRGAPPPTCPRPPCMTGSRETRGR